MARSNEISEPPTSFGKKSWSEKSWTEKRKTKFCGVPFLWIVLVAGAVAFIAALIGGVLGGFVEGQKHAEA